MNKLIKILIITITLLCSAAAQICLRKGMMDIKIDVLSLQKIFEIAKQHYVWLGLLFYGISFIAYLYVLTKFEVSYIQPIFMSIGIILLLTFSVIFLHESISFKKMLGTVIIVLGIIVLS